MAELFDEERIFFGNNISVLQKDETLTVYSMKDVTGDGTMNCYRVFPGIDLLYNDFHMQSCFSKFRPKVDMIGIDHCREGRIEWEFKNGSFMYMEEGDLQIDMKKNHTNRFGFPLNHYHGITIAIYIDEAVKTLETVFDGYSVDLQALKEKFCLSEKPFIMRAEASIKHIFSELYTVPDKIRLSYYKIKILELLLFLSAVDIPAAGENRPYFPKNQVETVKEIMKYMTENLEKHFTLEELSAKFHMPLTTMKTCFKGIYGTSVYAFMRSYRIQKAALMIRENKENITVIAGKVGYNNPSKFSAAFKEITGATPLKYQKNFV